MFFCSEYENEEDARVIGVFALGTGVCLRIITVAAFVWGFGFYEEEALYVLKDGNTIGLCSVDSGRRLQIYNTIETKAYFLHVTLYGELVMDTLFGMTETIAEGVVVNTFLSVQGTCRHVSIGQRHVFAVEDNTVVMYEPKCLV